MLCLKLQQQQGNSGVMSVGGQLQSLTTYGYGTYEWVMRASSTSSTPAGAGAVVSGQISAGFNFVNNSQTEIDFEIEGQHPDTVWMTNWISTSKKQYSSVFLASPEAGFHHYKFVWVPGKIDYYIDGVLVSTHTSNLPSAPAYIMMNHWARTVRVGADWRPWVWSVICTFLVLTTRRCKCPTALKSTGVEKSPSHKQPSPERNRLLSTVISGILQKC